jgi:hypothetical protein
VNEDCEKSDDDEDSSDHFPDMDSEQVVKAKKSEKNTYVVFKKSGESGEKANGRKHFEMRCAEDESFD